MKRTNHQNSEQSKISPDNLTGELNADSRIQKIREAILKVPDRFFEKGEQKKAAINNIFFLLHFRFTTQFFREGNRKLQLKEFASLFNELKISSCSPSSSDIDEDISTYKSKLEKFEYIFDKSNCYSNDIYFSLRKQIIDMTESDLSLQFDAYKNWIERQETNDIFKTFNPATKVKEDPEEEKKKQPMENEEKHDEVFSALKNPLSVQVSNSLLVNTVKNWF